jgi:hypothetical protein
MAGLVPAIHVFVAIVSNKAWMPATSAGMTRGHLGWVERSETHHNERGRTVGFAMLNPPCTHPLHLPHSRPSAPALDQSPAGSYLSPLV